MGKRLKRFAGSAFVDDNNVVDDRVVMADFRATILEHFVEGLKSLNPYRMAIKIQSIWDTDLAVVRFNADI